MQNVRCAACGQLFSPRAQAPEQAYCSSPPCQRERRRRWQREKRWSDPDYQENQQKAQQAWCARNAGYWRAYRQANPEYSERNRRQQRARNAALQRDAIAKMNSCSLAAPHLEGVYRMEPVLSESVAKMDAWIVKITFITKGSSDLSSHCKERTS